MQIGIVYFFYQPNWHSPCQSVIVVVKISKIQKFPTCTIMPSDLFFFLYLVYAIWMFYLPPQVVKGGTSETRVEKRIVINADSDIDQDKVWALRVTTLINILWKLTYSQEIFSLPLHKSRFKVSLVVIYSLTARLPLSNSLWEWGWPISTTCAVS